jgi:hypothetical protein
VRRWHERPFFIDEVAILSPLRLTTLSLVLGLSFTLACNFGPIAPGNGQPGYFPTLPPGSTLPSGAECAERVRRSDWEPRPENAQANQTKGVSGIRVTGGSETFNDRYVSRVDGDFTGTTDEIIQWGACKWGFDEDIARSVAVVESWWRQSHVGNEGESFGLMQVRATVHIGTHPYSQNSTAFNVDYALAFRRACFEGEFTWLNGAGKQGGYVPGDEWGCVGLWYSGDWYDGDENVPHSGARAYIKEVKSRLAERTWTTVVFTYP